MEGSTCVAFTQASLNSVKSLVCQVEKLVQSFPKAFFFFLFSSSDLFLSLGQTFWSLSHVLSGSDPTKNFYQSVGFLNNHCLLRLVIQP